MSWTEDVWADVYEFRKNKSGLTSHTDKYVMGQFQGPAHSKEGYVISNCKNDRHRQVLNFLILILYPKKPTWVIVIVPNTIFGVLEDKFIYYERLIDQIVTKLVDHLIRVKHNPITPYLFHLYHQRKVLISQEIIAYHTGLAHLKYSLTDGY